MTTQPDAAEAYRALVVAWLRHKEAKWRETARDIPGAAGDAASFYAAAYHNAADGIERGEPERRAALPAAPQPSPEAIRRARNLLRSMRQSDTAWLDHIDEALRLLGGDAP